MGQNVRAKAHVQKCVNELGLSPCKRLESCSKGDRAHGPARLQVLWGVHARTDDELIKHVRSHLRAVGAAKNECETGALIRLARLLV